MSAIATLKRFEHFETGHVPINSVPVFEVRHLLPAHLDPRAAERALDPEHPPEAVTPEH